MDVENNISKYWITILPFGEENAIHQKPLADRLEMKPEQLKAAIRAARLRGVEICSSTAGYFLPKDDTERRKFVAMQERQANTRYRTSKAIRHNISKIKGQQTFDVVQDDLESIRKGYTTIDICEDKT